MNAIVAFLSVVIVGALAVWAGLALLGTVGFTVLAAILGFFALMSVCAKFWGT